MIWREVKARAPDKQEFPVMLEQPLPFQMVTTQREGKDFRDCLPKLSVWLTPAPEGRDRRIAVRLMPSKSAREVPGQ